MRLILTAIVANLLLAGTMFGDTINVPADYPTIQDAIDASSNGDEIVVSPGVYKATDPWSETVVSIYYKSLLLRSSGTASETIIDGEDLRRCLMLIASEVHIEGFTISNGNADEDIFGGGIYCTSGDVYIKDCVIRNNVATIGGGISFDGSSLILNETSVCENQPDQIYGEWTDAGGNVVAALCNDPVGACCFDANCFIANETDCTGDWLGDGTTCDGKPCYIPPSGACCINQTCTLTTQDDCQGQWLGEDTNCNSNPCYIPPSGACCINQTCTLATQDDCQGQWLGADTNCNSNPCYIPPSGACCINQTCTLTTQDDCQGQWLGADTNCNSNPCYIPPPGACCNGEECSITIETDCIGDWLGDKTTCNDNPCYEPPSGVCCIDQECVVSTEDNCQGQWLGNEYSCESDICSLDQTIPLCLIYEKQYIYELGYNLIVCKLFVEIPENTSLKKFGGTNEQPMMLHMDSGQIFQEPYVGGPTSLSINSAFFPMYPLLQWDSYFSIGSIYADGTPFPYNFVTSTGIDWWIFEAGIGLYTNGYMHLVSDVFSHGEPINGRVFIGQLSFDSQDWFSGTFTANFQWEDEHGTVSNAYRQIGFSASLDECGITPDCGPQEPPCIGDLNDDGNINIDDVLRLLSSYGSNCECPCPECPCPGDLSGNLLVDVNDLLLILELYGSDC